MRIPELEARLAHEAGEEYGDHIYVCVTQTYSTILFVTLYGTVTRSPSPPSLSAHEPKAGITPHTSDAGLCTDSTALLGRYQEVSLWRFGHTRQ